MQTKTQVRPKPFFGMPCNGCGLCCMRERCPVSEIYFGKGPGPCPALTPDGTGGYRCGLAIDGRVSAAEREAVTVAIGAGFGCDAAPETALERAVADAVRTRLRAAVVAANDKLSPAALAVVEGWRTVYARR